MEKTYYRITELNKQQWRTKNVADVLEAFRRGCDAVEIEVFESKTPTSVIQLTITTQIYPSDFIQ